MNDWRRERDEFRERLEEREADMHTRIRAGYDATIADSWRAAHAKVEAERDEARAEVERLREALRAIAAGFDTITGSVDDPSAKQVDGYFRGYAQATLEKGTP